MNKIIIDKSNQYLIHQILEGYSFSCFQRFPRKTQKGYLGSKSKTLINNMVIYNKEDAENLFHIIKDYFLFKYIKKENIGFQVSVTPIYYYKVKCPNCGKMADILTFIMCSGIGDNFGSPISCKYCSKNKKIWYMNTVGECEYLDTSNEESELEIRKEYHNTGVRFENWKENLK